jgi:hypothetical protein
MLVQQQQAAIVILSVICRNVNIRKYMRQFRSGKLLARKTENLMFESHKS